jgi:zinc-finger of transposase IS204/IS1001/IS1096/IS1165/Transposase
LLNLAGSAGCDISELAGIVFSGLSSLVIEDVTDRDEVIVVRARTAAGPVACPRCGSLTGQVHGYYQRTVADLPADGRPVVVNVRVRRMRCAALSCPVQTFREQVPGVLGRYQRRTTRLAGQAGEVTRRLAGRAGAGLLAALGIPLSRHTALRILLRLPLPEIAVPRVLGVDDFALRRGQVYATILIDAQTGQRVDVLASRRAGILEAWLRDHPGVEVVCRDGSGAYGEAVRRALPGAVQAGDRWHLWHSLGEAVLKEVAAHSACWAAAGPPLNEGRQAQTTAERWRQVHDLTDRGTGLLECSRRLGLSLNTVKRYARAAGPGRMIRAPRYRATLAGPYRDHLRARRAEDPAVPVHQLLAEIREQGYPGSMNLLYRYITQAASKPAGRTCPRGGWPGCCSPGPTRSATASRSCTASSPRPAPRSPASPAWSATLPPCSSPTLRTRPSSRTGLRPPAPATCRACMPSPAAWS